MRKKQLKISADKANGLCEILKMLPCNMFEEKHKGFRKAYDGLTRLILFKAGIEIDKDVEIAECLREVRQRVLTSYGMSYVNASYSGVWDELGVDEADVQGALMLGLYLSRIDNDGDFLNDLKAARSYFEKDACHDDYFLTDMEDEYELDSDELDDDDISFLRGFHLVIDFIDDVCLCLKEGVGRIADTTVEYFYEAVVAIDSIYKDYPELFLEHLPGLLIKMAEPYVAFDYQGNEDGERLCGCLAQDCDLIKGAAAILPYLEEESKDKELCNLRNCLEWMMGGLFTFSEYTQQLCYYRALGDDILISSLCPEGESQMGSEPVVSFGELFAPLIWEALYPVVAARYVKEDVYEQAA